MRYVSHLAVVLGVLAFGAAVRAQTTRPGDEKIVVLPFTPLNPSQEQAWLGRSIQQSVLADLTAAAPGRMMSSDVEVTDMAAAAEIGRHAGAGYVVHGSFTTLPTSGTQGMRIMGEVIDSASGRPVAAFKATGLYSEIFRLEDQVASQIRQHMPGVLPPAAPVQSAPAVAQSEPAEGAQPQPMPQVNEYYSTYATPQAYVPADAYYNYNYATPYYSPYYYGYGYGYPYFGLGFGTAFFFSSSHDHYDHYHGGGYYGGGHGGYYGGGHGGYYGGGYGHQGGGGMYGGPHVNGGIYNAGGGHMGGGAAHGGHR